MLNLFSAAISDSRSSLKPKVVIVDDFVNKEDGLNHGHLVKRCLLEICPEAQVETINIGETKAGRACVNTLKLARAFNDIISRLKRGEKIDALNLSIRSDIDVPEQYTSFAENIFVTGPEFKGKIKEEIASNVAKEKAKKEVFKRLKNLAKLAKIKIFVSAGSNGAGKVNVYSTIDGVVTVGACDSFGRVEQYSSTLFADTFENGISTLRKKPEFFHFFSTNVVRHGASFAVPRALGKYLKALYRK